MKRKVLVTDSLFSMDGDFAPMEELSQLRRKYGFLLVIDDAHGTFVCGENGGGVAEEFNSAAVVDLCVGTLSKAAGCHGRFIACRYPCLCDLKFVNQEYVLVLVHSLGPLFFIEGPLLFLFGRSQNLLVV
ncbi:PREDICTED: 8-amino-7-oxononanoate synthase-like [Camelina sativa]|uniref:8-amino-7-oxononanoate synthase-like n=1 Tax=Camelina sativa TaxID=90675 RepID=A0ABM0U0M3_CAMSA|nr:PREDICTED: 8-amino-7-oxononanoate synthase-like [Camelina sativa]